MIDKKKQLKKHQTIATGLFVAMALVYVATLIIDKHFQVPALEYVTAFSEAAMVGALADWFAVTALFRHPLGLKIPHTNLIESNKDNIGENLGDFVTDNFLTPQTIRPYIQRLDFCAFIESWLSKKENQHTIEQEASQVIQHIISRIDQQSLIAYLTNKAQDATQEIPLQNLVSSAITYVVQNKELEGLYALIIPQIHTYLDQNKEDIYHKIIETKPILGLVAGKSITNQFITGLHSFLEDIAQTPNHKIKVEIYQGLEQLALKIEQDPTWKQKLDAMLSEYLTPEKLQMYIADLYKNMESNLLIQLNQNDSSIRTYIKNIIKDFEQHLNQDIALQNKINNALRVSLYKVTLRNAKQVGSIIKTTVEQWDGKELSEKLELEVGKDLQFIRINGTLIGGLVGLIIHILTKLFL